MEVWGTKAMGSFSLTPNSREPSITKRRTCTTYPNMLGKFRSSFWGASRSPISLVTNPYLSARH
jgi:hypothetical protein